MTYLPSASPSMARALRLAAAAEKERATRQVRSGDVEEVLVNAIATVRAVVTEAAA